jgi:cyclic beta-1,2-glucan synthetase
MKRLLSDIATQLGKLRLSRSWTNVEEPIRSELFSPERLEQHAATLAEGQAVYDTPRTGRSLVERLNQNALVLGAAHREMRQIARSQRAVSPAGEWLLDNFHIVEQQVREILAHLPAHYYRELPKLRAGPLAGYPRIYGLAWAYVAHTDSRFDADLMTRFVAGYQRTQALTLGELWALPITLKLTMIENLRRVSAGIVCALIGRELAHLFFEAADGSADHGRLDSFTPTLPDPAFRQAFAVQFVQRLRDFHSGGSQPSLDPINGWLAEQGLSIEDIVRREHAKQTAANVTVRNVITSMRDVSALDFRQFVEDVSLVEQGLRQNQRYALMDFLSRDRYRHAIEEISKQSDYSELEIATLLVEKTAPHPPPRDAQRSDSPTEDVGFHLIGLGRADLEHEVAFRPTWQQRAKRAYVRYPTTAYLSSIVAIAFALLSLPATATVNSGAAPWQTLVLAALGLFAATDMSTSFVNWCVMKVFRPRRLPRLDLADGVPSALRTFVVIPTMFSRTLSVEEQVRQLEIHYLANPLGEVHFALVSDWLDADFESLDTDRPLLDLAQMRIAALNERYGCTPSGCLRFFVFHRKRLWNPSEQKWMGWERKRGKLHEFNRLLRGATDTSFLPPHQPRGTVPTDVRYVVSLDADTKLPIGAVCQLVGTAAHALNRPQIDPVLQRVVHGYAVLQPRVSPTLPRGEERSSFQRIFSGAGGIDPYAGTISDIYQDFFGEGTYTGKGLYDVDAFEQALSGRVPENTLLSHDLFEGTFARCALVSDIEFFEDFPFHTEIAASRAHRWTRGDWQLLPWIIGRRGSAISALGRWKMLDNLRRSLSAPAALLTLVAAWSVPHAPTTEWLLLVIGALATPSLLALIDGLSYRRAIVTSRSHFKRIAQDILQAIEQCMLSLALLAHHAWLMSDAIARALFRMRVTRRRLLEWTTAAQAKAAANLSYVNFLWPLRSATIIVIGASASVMWFNPPGLRAAVPLVLLWWLAPLLARAVSAPPASSTTERISEPYAARLRLIGRYTWRFFTEFVGRSSHALPPDNFQEDPQPVVAHRGSPTNFGLYLLSVVAARDLGWIGLCDAAEKLRATLTTLRALERTHGHFFNWYDTQSLVPLEPRYISVVDSGNLAGHLLVLAQALQEMTRAPIRSVAPLLGLRDTLRAVEAQLQSVRDDRRTLAVTLAALKQGCDELRDLLDAAINDNTHKWIKWRALEQSAAHLLDLARTFTTDRGDGENSAADWISLFCADVQSHLRDLHTLAPWLLDAPLALESQADDEKVRHWSTLLHEDVSLEEIPIRCDRILQRLSCLQEDVRDGQGAAMDKFAQRMTLALPQAARNAERLLVEIAQLADGARALVAGMDFRFLFDFDRRLFPIGYRVSDGAFDTSYYDLLASEARLASFVAIAKHDVPASHWFRLGRDVTEVDGSPVLLSWSGSMFEYLMPSLVLYTPRGSLLDVSCRGAIRGQIQYSQINHVPWGISESAFNVRDRAYTYQYSDFGVPGLGLKRGLEQNLVIAPYATALASMYDVSAAVTNYGRLEDQGARGAYGFYEALDFTPYRRPDGVSVAPVRAYMAHHQGMSLVALANAVLDGIMRHRFHREPIVQAAELLLQERPPRELPHHHPRIAEATKQYESEPETRVSRHFSSAHVSAPTAHARFRTWQ